MLEIIGKDDTKGREARLGVIRSRGIALDRELSETVAEIIDDVRKHGDAALFDYTRRFDGVDLTISGMRFELDDIRRSAAKVSADVLAALRESIRRVRLFHEYQREVSWEMEHTRAGVRLGQRITPLESAGLYVPGGTAAYPSSVVMNAVPALVAGVERIVVVTPPGTLSDNPAVAAALLELGLDEVYSVGGAQAIAALAFGTETIPKVDKITGPGNRYVAAAKRLVFGIVGIDSIAGPSEIVIAADETAPPRFVAADMLAQSEHAEDAAAILVTTCADLADHVASELERQLDKLPRRGFAAASLANYGSIFVVNNDLELCDLVNAIAPEHLEIIMRDEEEIFRQIKHAGAIFLGAYTPEAVGDYFAGPNHVLPTGGAARFSSALGVHDFIRRTSVLRYSANELQNTARMIASLAGAEGLEAHARSAMIRFEDFRIDE